MSYRPLENMVLPQGIHDTSTTQKLPLGTIVRALDNTYGVGEFIYLKGAGSTLLGSSVIYLPDDFNTALLAAGLRGSVAFAMAANVANQYGFYQIKGKAIGKVLAAFADNGAIYATATPGSVDDAVVAGDLVHNALGASAIDTPSTGLAEIEIDRPFIDGADAALRPVGGVAAGYKIARGTVTLDGSNPTTVATGLATIAAAGTSLKSATAPGDDPSWLSHNYTGSDGNLDIYAWKNTGGTDPTLVASTNNAATVDWWAIGTG